VHRTTCRPTCVPRPASFHESRNPRCEGSKNHVEWSSARRCNSPDDPFVVGGTITNHGATVNWEIDSDGLKSEDHSTLKFGDQRDKVRAALGPFRTVKGPYGPETDQFVSEGVQVTYDSDSRAHEIMVGAPDQACFRGVDLLGRPIDEVLVDLRARGVKAFRDADGAVLPDDGMSLYAVGDRAEAVTVGYPAVSKT
jgi:hypothetical protein